MENKKKIRLLVLGTLFFVIALVGLTWAFFSYVYVGGDNIVKTGDITFEADYTSVTLTDVFPISASKVDTDTDNVMTVNVSISGHTSYKSGVEYQVMTKDVNLLSSGKNIPISVLVSSSNLPNVKTMDYKNKEAIANNSVLAQGSIMPSDGNVDGTITIKAYIDKANVVISDTYDGTESDEMGTTNDFINGREVFTTEEWNNFRSSDGISFKIKVISNIKESGLYDVLVDNAKMDNTSSEYVSSETGIDFGQISSNTNGRGLYMLSDTKDDDYPIMYYRGNVDNNNVMFGGFCWKIVRTTETGGIKLVYNGEPTDTYEKTILTQEQYSVTTNNGFTYDESSGYWKLTTAYTSGELSFTVPDANNYIVDVLGYVSNGAGVTGGYAVNKDSTNILNKTLNQYDSVTSNQEIGSLTTGNTVTISLTGAGWNYFYVRLIQKGDLIGTGCDNIGSSTQIKGVAFNKNKNSLAYNGYMYNKVYEYVDEEPVGNAYFSNDVIYANGVYQLQNAEVGYASSRHYTCNSTDSTGTCDKVRYYITNKRYMEFTNGIKINDAVNEMTNVNDINNTDSNAKTELEAWYSNNLSNYANFIEDTDWCNDRSIYSYGAFTTTGSGNLTYKAHNRMSNAIINLKCENAVDKFSLKNQLAKLNYPIGLLTGDEMRLAGAASVGVVNSNFYLLTKDYYWTMTPSVFNSSGPSQFYVSSSGQLYSSGSITYAFGLRPSISLVYGTLFEDGDGTVGNPYVIAEN